MRTLLLILPMILFLTACERTLIYSERTGFKLGIGVNDDPSTPIQVNAGLKRTVVGFVPPKEGVQDKQAKGEAVSMFSGFRMAYSDGSAAQPFSGKLSVRTQFASGNAAIAIADKPNVVKSIVNVVSTSYLRDPAGDVLFEFWKPDGKTIDSTNEGRIRDWLRKESLDSSRGAIPQFLRGKPFAGPRAKAVKELGLE